MSDASKIVSKSAEQFIELIKSGKMPVPLDRYCNERNPRTAAHYPYTLTAFPSDQPITEGGKEPSYYYLGKNNRENVSGRSVAPNGENIYLKSTKDEYNLYDFISSYYCEEVANDAYNPRKSHASLNEIWLMKDTKSVVVINEIILNSFIDYYNDYRHDDLNEILSSTILRNRLMKLIIKNIHKSKLYISRYCPSWMYTIMTRYIERTGQNILDPFAGWGDRLIASIGMGCKYTGFDVNKSMKPCYDKIIDELAYGDHDNYKVNIIPFENAQLEDETYDCVFTSPPYAGVEIYEKNNRAQSWEKYRKNFDSWLKNFYLYCIEKAWRAIKPGGYMTLQINDRVDSKINLPTIKKMNELGATYMGCLIVVTNNGFCNYHQTFFK